MLTELPDLDYVPRSSPGNRFGHKKRIKSRAGHVEIMSKSCRNHAYEGLIHDFDHPYSVQLGWDPKMFSSTETWSTLGSGKLMVFDGFSGIGLIVDGCC